MPLILKEGMKSLNSRQRSAIILRYIYGFSDTEIGERLGITRQAVNRLQRKSLNILREVLEKKKNTAVLGQPCLLMKF